MADQPASDEGKPCRILLSVSSRVYAASARDRADRKFSEIAERLLANYYFSDTPDDVRQLREEVERQEAAAKPLLASLEALKGRLAAAEAKARETASESNEAWALAEALRPYIQNGGAKSRRQIDSWLEARGWYAKLSRPVCWQVVHDLTGIDYTAEARA